MRRHPGGRWGQDPCGKTQTHAAGRTQDRERSALLKLRERQADALGSLLSRAEMHKKTLDERWPAFEQALMSEPHDDNHSPDASAFKSSRPSP